jgi:hypothetical protein
MKEVTPMTVDKMTVRDLERYLDGIENKERVVIIACGENHMEHCSVDKIALGRFRDGWVVSDDQPGEPALVLYSNHE